MDIINTFLISKMLCGLQSYSLSARILRDADRMIKRAVKYVLHLHRSATVVWASLNYAQPFVDSSWLVRNYVSAIHLRTANQATKTMPSVLVERRLCHGGCSKNETVWHILQACPITHHAKIKMYNEIVKKIEQHCESKKWTVENKPKIRHPDGQLYKPDLAIHISDHKLVVTDCNTATQLVVGEQGDVFEIYITSIWVPSNLPVPCYAD